MSLHAQDIVKFCQTLKTTARIVDTANILVMYKIFLFISITVHGDISLSGYPTIRVEIKTRVMLCYVMLCYVMLCYVMLC